MFAEALLVTNYVSPSSEENFTKQKNKKNCSKVAPLLPWHCEGIVRLVSGQYLVTMYNAKPP